MWMHGPVRRETIPKYANMGGTRRDLHQAERTNDQTFED